MNKVRAKNLYTGKSMPKTGTFYRSHLEVSDSFKAFPIYFRNKADYYVDIPVGSNDLGIIFNGYFIRMTKGHPYTLCTKDKMGKITKILLKEKRSILDEARTMIKSHQELK